MRPSSATAPTRLWQPRQAERIPAARLVVLDSGHFSLLEDTDSFLETVRSLLA